MAKPPISRELQLLDTFSARDIRNWNKFSNDLRRYQWELYQCMSYQQKAHWEQIKSVLLGEAKRDLNIKGWRRLIFSKYSNEVLSTKGSKVRGGRFNLGGCEGTNLKEFGALYIAERPQTAIFEALGSTPLDDNSMHPLDVALTTDANYSIFSINGYIETYIDLTTDEALNAFVKITKGFEIRDYVNDLAKQIDMPPSTIVKSAKRLRQSIMHPEYAQYMAMFDVPSNSQQFGSMARDAGIEAILYPSVKKRNDKCLAIFVENFKSTGSYVEISGECAPTVKPLRVDSSNCLDC